jgi:hypothetical protein
MNRIDLTADELAAARAELADWREAYGDNLPGVLLAYLGREVELSATEGQPASRHAAALWFVFDTERGVS